MSPVYKHDEIVAYEVGAGVYCPDCIKENDQVNDVYDETRREQEELTIFCDCCKKEC